MEPSVASDDVRGAERGDLGVADAVLAKHLVGVLAERGREPLDAGRRLRQLDRRRERPDAAAPGLLTLGDGAVRGDLRVREDVLEEVHAARRDVVRLEEGDPLAARAAAEYLAQDRHDLGAMLHAEVVRPEARVGEKVLASDRGAEALEERVRETGDDEPAVARR